MLTDEMLYARVQRGDRAALAELVERYHSTLFKFLYRMTGDASAAEDLVQEAFVRMITFRGKTPNCYRSWAYTIAANLARDIFRSAVFQREIQQPLDDRQDSLASFTDSAEAVVFRRVDCHHLENVLQSLPVAQREVIVLRYYHEQSLDEISQVCGIPLGTVKSRLYRGLRHLKNTFEREERGIYEQAI
ncbi:MAG TPA: sigma-70 family RNA polymerase sigma factor [Levilinea sp.]|nr:sigma-70 family RNA polymerase sigma factor [Levilinea sp.]